MLKSGFEHLLTIYNHRLSSPFGPGPPAAALVPCWCVPLSGPTLGNGLEATRNALTLLRPHLSAWDEWKGPDIRRYFITRGATMRYYFIYSPLHILASQDCVAQDIAVRQQQRFQMFAQCGIHIGVNHCRAMGEDYPRHW